MSFAQTHKGPEIPALLNSSTVIRHRLPRLNARIWQNRDGGKGVGDLKPVSPATFRPTPTLKKQRFPSLKPLLRFLHYRPQESPPIVYARTHAHPQHDRLAAYPHLRQHRHPRVAATPRRHGHQPDCAYCPTTGACALSRKPAQTENPQQLLLCHGCYPP